MSWVTVIWSIGSGACLTLALMNCVIWWKDRTAQANLVFSVMAIAVAIFAALELALMRAQTSEQFSEVVRWLHVPVWVMIASLVAFVRLYLRAGRRWLAWTVVGVRTLSLILNFTFWPNINYRQIIALRRIPFLGEPVSVASGVPNPLMLVAQFSLLLLVVFVTDAMITVWRRGDRRQALVVGGSTLFFVVLGTAQGVAIGWGFISMPVTVSLFYQCMVAAMACELSYDMLRAAALARQLHASEAGLRGARSVSNRGDAAPVLIWMSAVDKMCTFFNRRWLEFTGRSLEQELETVGLRRASERSETLPQHLHGSVRCAKPFVMQYRLRRNDGEYRWISDEGVPRYNAHGTFAGYIGSCVDVTELLRQQKALASIRGTRRACGRCRAAWSLGI